MRLVSYYAQLSLTVVCSQGVTAKPAPLNSFGKSSFQFPVLLDHVAWWQPLKEPFPIAENAIKVLNYVYYTLWAVQMSLAALSTAQAQSPNGVAVM